MPSPIPKHIHFFWGTKHLPKEEFENILTFIKYTGYPWKITIWTDDIKAINNSPVVKAFSHSLTQGISPRVKVKEIRGLIKKGIALLNDRQKTLTPEWAIKFPGDSFDFLESFLQQISVGLTVPTSIKDIILPLALYCYGGYGFDLDARATVAFDANPSPATHGIFTLRAGNLNAALAMSANHDVGFFCFLVLRNWLTPSDSTKGVVTLPLLNKQQLPDDNPPKLDANSYFDLDIMKNQNGPDRTFAIDESTGKILGEAVYTYCVVKGKSVESTVDSVTINTQFCSEILFPPSQSKEFQDDGVNQMVMVMGVEINTAFDGTWRAPSKVKHSYEIDNASLFFRGKTSREPKEAASKRTRTQSTNNSKDDKSFDFGNG